MASSRSYQPPHRARHSSTPQDWATDPSRFKLIEFLAIAQAHQIEFLPLIPDIARGAIGTGSTSHIRQSLFNIETSLAFKSFSEGNHTDEVVYQTLINEISMLGRPAIRAQPCISQLQGICWETPTRGAKPRPVLVFEKSRLGDLWHFIHNEGRELAVEKRFSLCLDIGSAIYSMHMIGVVHGDIKPQNILIFTDELGEYRAKVIDFGYSAQYTDEQQQRILYGTEVWNAPEHGIPAKRWTLQEARMADLFTFGTLCLWLFETSLCGAISDKQPVRRNATMGEVVPYVEKGSLQRHARKILAQIAHLGHERAAALQDLFESSLSLNPKEREGSLTRFIKEPGDERDKLELGPLSNEVVTNIGCSDFDVRESILQLYGLDYQVRSYITECLAHLAPHSKALAMQAAFCYYIGFGVARNKAKAADQVAPYGQSIKAMENMIQTTIRETRYTTSVITHLRRLGYLKSADIYQMCLEQGRLTEAEECLQRENKALSEVFGADHALTLLVQKQLMQIYSSTGRWKEAELLGTQMLREQERSLGEEDPSTLESMSHLTSTYWSQGRWKEAEVLGWKEVKIRQEIIGEEHPSTLTAMANLASTYQVQGRWKEAESLEVQVLQKRQQLLGEEHPDTLTAMANLASTYGEQGRWKEAETLEVQVLEKTERLLGEEHPDTLISIANLALTYGEQQKWKEAETLEIQVIEVSKRVLGEEHPDTLTRMSNLASTYGEQRRWREAETLGIQVIEVSKRVLGEEHPDTLTRMANLASIYGEQGRWKEAELLGVQVMKTRQKVLGGKHPDTLTSMINLACLCKMKGSVAEGIQLLESSYQLQVDVLGLSHQDTIYSATELEKWRADEKDKEP